MIVALAGEFNSTGKLNDENSAELSVKLRRVDGRDVSYVIEVWSERNTLRAKESTCNHLPSFCPERHINSGGSFCLYWEGSEQLDVVDEASARIWMETLIQFLRLQERAAKMRRWPSRKAWAHGNAAKYQLQAMEAAVVLGIPFPAKIEEGALTIIARPRRGRNTDSIVEVEQDGVHLFSIWKTRRMLVNNRKKCFCCISGLRRPKRIGRCKNHAAAALALAEALLGWDAEEKKFWDSWQGSTCCGTCNECPLAMPATNDK